MAKMTQKDIIIRHLKDYGEITSLTAFTEYGIMRLASRVSDLKKLGFPIVAEMGTAKNRYNETVHFAVYRLKNNNESEGISA